MTTQPVESRGHLLRLDAKTGVLRERTYAIELLSGAKGRRVVPLEQPLVLGSSPESGLWLEDTTVSRQHVELTPKSEGVRVRDLRSTNGTYLAGVRVEEAVLEDEATLTLGNVRLRVLFLDTEVEMPKPQASFGEAVAQSQAMRKLFGILTRVAASESTVILLGETGTGKDLLARGIHEHSTRKNGPFVVLDCGAMASDLAESELFGHIKGSFTGATTDRDGAFARANGGTLYLDSVSEIPLELQTRLLRALAEGSVRRIGDNVARSVDVRVVASSHRPLEEEVMSGRFRADLYFRLAVAVVEVPALRDRPEDITLLANHFWNVHVGAGPLKAKFQRMLGRHPWSGNVRELRNVMERAFTLHANSEELEIQDEAQLQSELFQRAMPPPSAAKRSLSEKERILDALQKCAGNQTQAAKALGVSRGTLLTRLDDYGIPRPRKASLAAEDERQP